MRVIINNIFPRGTYIAINLFGIILSRRPLSDVERNHEYIHTLQQRELLWVGFYLWYSVEWLVRLCAKRNAKRAYFSVSFEREAYTHESELTYPSHRPLWAWTRHIVRRHKRQHIGRQANASGHAT